MKKKSPKIIDMHVDPLVQANLFNYKIKDQHNYDWKPDKDNDGKNLFLWNFYRNFVFDPKKSPMFNHVDVPRMLNLANYRAAGFGIVQPKLFHFRFDEKTDEYGHDPKEYDLYLDDVSLLEEISQNSLVYSQFEDYWKSLSDIKDDDPPMKMAQKQLEHFRILLDEAKDKVYPLKEPTDLDKPENSDRLGIFPAIEGAHCLDALHFAETNTRLRGQNAYLDKLKEVYNKYHIRYITLHHFVHNKLGKCSLSPLLRLECQKDANSAHLEPFGKIFIRAMYDLGIIVDVSHTCTQAIQDIYDDQKGYIAKKKGNMVDCRKIKDNIPIIASHAVSRKAYIKIVNDRRNLQNTKWNYREELWKWRGLADESIKCIARTGGVIGVSVCPKHLSGSNHCTVVDWAHHCHTICDIIETMPGYEGQGKNYLAIGTDFDGWIPSLPEGFQDCRNIDKCINALNSTNSRTFSDDDIEALCSGNFIMAWEKVRNARQV